MGTSKSGAELAHKLFNAGNSIEKATRSGLLAGGQTVKAAALAQLAAAGAGSGRMRGVGKSGARVGVGYDIVRAAGGEAAVRVGMKGPVHLLERDTRPHMIEPRRGEALQFSDGRFRAYVAHHPGTRGKHPWEKALTASLPLVPQAIQHQVTVGLIRAFR